MTRMTKNESDDLSRRTGRRVLMICHAFPPTGGPGVQRSAKFARYLPEFGWQPTVWTADAVEGLPRDATLCAELPRDVVVRAHRAGGGVHALHRAIRGFIDANEGSRMSSAASRVARAIDWRLQAWLAGSPFPDDCAGWAKRSVRPLLRLIEEQGIDALYSTFSPASNHWLGLELKRRTGLPWIADFRDLWTDDYRYRETSEKRRAGHRQLEEEILTEADVVVGVTPSQTAILAERVAESPAKFITITNGFDPADFEDATRDDDSDERDGALDDAAAARRRFVIAHVGRLDVHRTSDALWEGLAAFGQSLGEERERAFIRFVGHINAAARERIAATGLPCRFEGYAPHAEAIRAMREADALLLIAPTGPNSETWIAAKMFEYLAARRPVVLVGPPGGECERIVRSCRAGVVAPLEQSEVASAFGRVFEAWRTGRPMRGCAPSRLRPYSRVELTKRLAETLDRLAATRLVPVSSKASLLESTAP